MSFCLKSNIPLLLVFFLAREDRALHNKQAAPFIEEDETLVCWRIQPRWGFCDINFATIYFIGINLNPWERCLNKYFCSWKVLFIFNVFILIGG